jgi:2-polyprenyl-3-methyl-5-hydroxy-6-metoxy-1,4-benzoquinol methylase
MRGHDRETTARPRCPVCNDSRVGPHRTCGQAEYYRCGSCEALFQHPAPEVEARLRYAEAEYADGGYREYVAAREMKLEHFRRRMAAIRHRLPPGRLLDVGCSCGYFLEVAASEGYDVHGVEFSRRAIAAAHPDIGPRIQFGCLESLSRDGEAERFDVITAFDLIEHLERPLDFLVQARASLAAGGVLVLSTPDAGHWLAALMRSHWPMLQPMQHLTIFSRRALAQALSVTGFRDITIGAASKVISAEYLVGQLKTLSPAVHGVLRTASRAIPVNAMRRYRSVNIGELLSVAVNPGMDRR